MSFKEAHSFQIEEIDLGSNIELIRHVHRPVAYALVLKVCW